MDFVGFGLAVFLVQFWAISKGVLGIGLLFFFFLNKFIFFLLVRDFF